MKDLAEKHEVKYSTLRSRKNREGWQQGVATNDATDNDGRGAPKGNQNAKGNRGNPNASPPPNNKNAVSHGLFANWMPDEALEIIKEVGQMSPADMIWQNILIQYTAIIRSQKIMYVASAHDDINNITAVKVDPMLQDSEGNPAKVEEKREWHMAYQKQEAFMNSQSRAMGTLSNLIKQFVALADEDDKRKQELELMTKQVKRVQVETDIKEKELEEIKRSGQADDEKIIFVDSSDEMQKWMDEHGS